VARTRRVIEAVSFARDRALPIEVVPLRALLARSPRDLSTPERPDFNIVLLVTRGEGTHTVDFVEHRLARGQVLVVTAGQVHHFGPPGSLDGALLVFKPHAVRWKPQALSPVLSLSPQRRALVTSLFEGLDAELGPQGGRSPELAAALVEALGAALESSTVTPSRAQALVGRFRAELERHHRRAHEVSAYAAILRCTTKTLTRHCLEFAGAPPKRLIDDRVALEARRSLAHEDRSVAELSEWLGFASATQFVKFFKRVTGETPGAFRGRVRAPSAAVVRR
jgi:AraC-like DNA-binding protein